MNIIIAGCGKVGKILAANLHREGHNVTVVDQDATKLKSFVAKYDIMGVLGNCATHTTLEEAGIKDTDLMIAVTGSDELNMLSCVLANRYGTRTIARVRNHAYFDDASYLKDELGLGMIINPEYTTAKEIAGILSFPAAISIEPFMGGKVEILKFRLPEGNKLVGMTVKDAATTFKLKVLLAVVERGDEVYIPSGDFAFEERDIISVVTTHRTAVSFFKKIDLDIQSAKSTIILGGGQATHYLLEMLENSGVNVKVVEKNHTICTEYANEFDFATIINADPSDKDVLREEGLERAEAFVSLVEKDEDNILLSFFAKNAGTKKVITRINRIDYDDIIEQFDIDSIIYPKDITLGIVTRYVRGMTSTRGSDMTTLYNLIPGIVEAAEFSITEESSLVGSPLFQLGAKLKPNVLIAAIRRGGSIILPRGGDSILVGDSVIVITKNLPLTHITDILK
jgi:trk system potassium uptake protein TrkA